MGNSKGIGLCVVTVFLFLLMTSIVYATEYFCDDSGNCYYVQKHPNTTETFGSNSNTGSQWYENYNHNTGIQKGRDSNGNWWVHDPKKGTYWNSNGERRTYSK